MSDATFIGMDAFRVDEVYVPFDDKGIVLITMGDGEPCLATFSTAEQLTAGMSAIGVKFSRIKTVSDVPELFALSEKMGVIVLHDITVSPDGDRVRYTRVAGAMPIGGQS